MVSGGVLTEQLSKYVLPMSRFEGVSLTAMDPVRVAAFWRVVLGGSLREFRPGHLRIDPARNRPATEIVRVTKSATPAPDQQRVHLDVRLGHSGPEQLLAEGGFLVRRPGPDPWYVLADPEGNEFCAYPAVDERPPGIFELVVKCREPHRLAAWWARVLGGDVADEGSAAVVAGMPEFPWDFLVFDRVPSVGPAPNRMHWHVRLRDPDPTQLVGAGAVVVRTPGTGEQHWVLADPEGNEFCAYPPAADF